MRRLSHLAFNLAAAVSLVLCMAVTALWALGFVSWFHYRWGREDSAHAWITDIETVRGGFQYHRVAEPPIAGLPNGPYVELNSKMFGHSLRSRSPDIPARFWGFGQASGIRPDGRLHTYVVVPGYAVAIPLAVLPLLWMREVLRQRRRRSRQRETRCQTCGYDLRATPERCPECGAAAVRATRGKQKCAGMCRDAPERAGMCHRTSDGSKRTHGTLGK